MDNARTSGMPGWAKILLAASLALNMLFLGLMGGRMLSGEMREGRDDPPGAFLASLPEERAAEVRAYFKEMREQRRAARKERRGQWAKVREAVTADPFDRAALEAAVEEIADSRDATRRARYARMVDFIESMSLEERKAFSDAMRERWKRRREQREKRRGG